MGNLSVGPFDLIRPIGKGSMGVVWEGIHRSQGLLVAVKVLTTLGAQEETFRVAFANEVRAVARLHHPSIIRLLDYGMTDEALCLASEGQIASGSPYYAMELATGGTLPRPQSPLPWLQMRYLLLELLDALAHAHARDVIHRDIKPGNILLMHEGDLSHVMLTDFGIAKTVGDKELPNGVVAGTPRYMAPEQILNQVRDQGPWTDLYSIGCLAYLFATGHRIFPKATGSEVLRCQLNEMPAPVSSPHLPSGFQGWLSRMLAKKTSDRFEFAAEAAWELVNLSEPEAESPDLEARTVSIVSGVLPDSCDNSSVKAGNSGFFNTLYPQEQLDFAGHVECSSNSCESIADDLLADMGETVRIDSEALAESLAKQQKSSEGLGAPKVELATLAQLYRQCLNSKPIHYGDKAIVPAPNTWRRESRDSVHEQLVGAGLGLWGLRYIPFVDRTHERDVIYEQLIATRTDRTARCIVLDGPRGTGKSRIVEWMFERAHELSIAHTLKAYHYEDHIKAPGLIRALMFHLVCQNLTRDKALERIQNFLSDPEHQLAQEYDDALPLLELMHLKDDPEHPVPSIYFLDNQEQYDVICRYLRRVCHDRAIVLWLDDVHYSSYSLEFIEHLLKTNGDIPVLILATTRSEELENGSAAYASFQRILSSEHVTKLDIAPLTPEYHLELVHQLIGLDDDLCAQVAQRTSGMPLFAIQLVGDWVERGVLVPSQTGFKVRENASVDLPDSLHELWISRLRSIFRDFKRPSRALEQLEIAACLGDHFDADEWRIACDMSQLGSNTKTLEKMLEHQLFEVRYPIVRFVHNLLRESLTRYSKENGRYKQLHQLCANMLEEYFSGALSYYHERRAEHLYEAEAYEACIEPLLLGAIYRKQRAEYETAHKLFRKRETCLDKCNADKNSPIRALGWIAEANTWIFELKFEEAIPLIENSLELGMRTHSPIIQALAYKEKGTILHHRNNIAEAIDALMASLSFFNQIGERRKATYLNDRAETLWLIGRICDTRHELDLARDYFQQAIEIQTQTNDQFGLARSYRSLGNSLQHGGFYAEAQQSLEYAHSVFQQMGYRSCIADCLNDIGEVYRLGFGQFEQAEMYYRSAIEMYHNVNPLKETTPLINLVLLLLRRQRFIEAKPLVIEQIQRIEDGGTGFDLNWLYAELLPCCAATFDWPTFDDAVLRLGKSLEDSMVVDADILYCTELAVQLCERCASRQQSMLCREIAIQQAVRLNDNDALQRLQA